MFHILQNINIDWLGNRLWFIGISVLLMLAGLASAIVRQATGGQAFNLGVDFKGGTVVTASFKQKPGDEAIRAALVAKGVRDAVGATGYRSARTPFSIKVPLEEGKGRPGQVREALNTFGRKQRRRSSLRCDPNCGVQDRRH
jgi:preprotein translocase subunit SecF